MFLCFLALHVLVYSCKCLESGHKKVAGVYLSMKELYHSTFLNCEHIHNYSFELSSLAGLALCCN